MTPSPSQGLPGFLTRRPLLRAVREAVAATPAAGDEKK